ncbi:MAG: sulfite exporter TauE/SafE family protein [Alphaproteobacteria bacterium]|nr:sulfite exporter TauE/SafE family protein [Alphaproteobacteria bacterium]
MIGLLLGGALSGLALGMIGAGGTIIGLPMILYLGGPQGHAAFGTNAFGVASIAALLLLWRVGRREIQVAPGIAFALPGLAGIAVGAHLGLLYPAQKLVFFLGFLILVVAAWIGYLGLRPADADGAPPNRTSPVAWRHLPRLVPVAFAIGVVSGLFAIGGGFLVVPGLALAAAIDLRASARSSLIPIAAFAGLDAIEYLKAGDVRLAASALMIAAGVVGGAIGLVLGSRLSLRTIQRIFAIFLAAIAIYMVAPNI